MPTLPLYSQPADPDAWHRVTAPGGYEQWHFDAEDAAGGGVRLVADFYEGFPFDPAYLRQYRRYRRNPTRHRPPVPGDGPCVSFALYEQDRVVAQFTSLHPAATFVGSSESPDVTIGRSRITREVDGALRLHAEGVPQAPASSRQVVADVVFRPILRVPSYESSSQGTGVGEHRWVVVHPLCAVEGTVRIAGGASGGHPSGRLREIAIAGRGYHDHRYGTGPVGVGRRRGMWGRVLLDGRVAAFHVAHSADPSLVNEVRLVEADASGIRPVEVRRVEAEWNGRAPSRGAYPKRVRFDDVLGLDNPRVVESAARPTRIVYDATWRGARVSAFCEIIESHRPQPRRGARA